MNVVPDHTQIMSQLKRLDTAYTETPLTRQPGLAARTGLSEVYVKDESRRPMGSFKALGGTYASLEAIASLGQSARKLVCASDGNHGLAVATAARHAGLPAQVFLPADVSSDRVRRIERAGANVILVDGTFDEAVEKASQASQEAGTILIADTTDNVEDVVTGNVMTGYSVIAGEARDQFRVREYRRPTHLFVQAGVGGLAAAMARGLKRWMDDPAEIIVVEPEAAACVAAALHAGQPVGIAGDLRTCASMLSCGRASAPAFRILADCRAAAVSVSEEELATTPAVLKDCCAIETTPSGAAGLAGLLHVLKEQDVRAELALGPESRVLLVVSEGR